jgi:hypothetical protein
MAVWGQEEDADKQSLALLQKTYFPTATSAWLGVNAHDKEITDPQEAEMKETSTP